MTARFPGIKKIRAVIDRAYRTLASIQPAEAAIIAVAARLTIGGVGRQASLRNLLQQFLDSHADIFENCLIDGVGYNRISGRPQQEVAALDAHSRVRSESARRKIRINGDLKGLFQLLRGRTGRRGVFEIVYSNGIDFTAVTMHSDVIRFSRKHYRADRSG